MKRFVFLVSLLGALTLSVWSQEYKVSVAQMPVYAESLTKGVLIDFIKAMATETGTKLNVQLVPFTRSMDAVEKADVDFHMPLIKNPNLDDHTLPYLHSTETIFHVNFVLYTRKDATMDRKKLEHYKIETDAAHVPYFPFPTIASYDLAASMRKLEAGRIDGVIFADNAIDPLLAQLALKDIQRDLYFRFDVKIILPRNDKFAATDAWLTASIKKMKASGTYGKIMDVLDRPFAP